MKWATVFSPVTAMATFKLTGSELCTIFHYYCIRVYSINTVQLAHSSQLVTIEFFCNCIKRRNSLYISFLPVSRTCSSVQTEKTVVSRNRLFNSSLFLISLFLEPFTQPKYACTALKRFHWWNTYFSYMANIYVYFTFETAPITLSVTSWVLELYLTLHCAS